MAGQRFSHELSDVPAQMNRAGIVLNRIQRNSSKSTRILACLLCARTEELDTVRGLCWRCNPPVEPWRLVPAGAPVLFYEVAA